MLSATQQTGIFQQPVNAGFQAKQQPGQDVSAVYSQE
jgi:hypothetical protein